MKKIKSTILTLTGIVAIAGLASCGKNSNSAPAYTDAEVVAMESISAVNTINMIENKNNKLMSSVDLDEVKSIIDKGNVLAKDSIKIESYESDREEFLEKKVLTYSDYTYTLYVKESFEEIDTEDDDEDDEVEKEVKYSGVLVSGDKEYDFFVKEEIEADSDEYESEFQMTVIVDEDTKVLVKQEYEAEDDEIEESFECKYTIGGNTLDAYKIKKEYENGKYEIKVRTLNDEFSLKYYTKNLEDLISVKSSNYEVVLKIVKTTDEFGSEITSYELYE